MPRHAILILGLALSGACLIAQTGLHELRADVSAAGLLPVTWASDGPTLAHRGLDALLGLEYDSPQSLELRFELGYIGATASYISSSGELYRGWDGLRFALLAGWGFKPLRAGNLGTLRPSLLAGGALTAAVYSHTALAYAYPSLIMVPRLALVLRPAASTRAPATTASAAVSLGGPWLALPIELMFRAGTHSLAPGLSLGWSYRVAAAR
jgi:hypothetical protein